MRKNEIVEASSADVLIVGAGPAGLACAIELQRRGLETLLIEKGCVVNSLTNFPTYMRFFTSADGLEIGGVPMTSHGDRPGRTEAVKYYQRLVRHFGLKVRQYEQVTYVHREGHTFAIQTSRRRRQARRVIVATGYCDHPVMLGIPGEQLPKVMHYYKEPHAYFEQDVLVVGGRNSAGAAALELCQAGAHVTLVHRGPSLTDAMKPWIRNELEGFLRSGVIQSYFDAQLLQIQPESVSIQTRSGVRTLRNDFVFALTGYRPDVKFLADCGLPLDFPTGRPIIDAGTLETSTPGLYLAGVVVGGLNTNELNISHAREHAKQIGQHLALTLRSRVA